MKKTLFLIAALAGLAISVVTISCNKTEVAETPAAEAGMKNIRTPEIHLGVTPHEWWRRTRNSNVCVEKRYTNILCYISLHSADDPHNTWSTIIHDRAIVEMVYDGFQDLPDDSDIRKAYEQFLANGFIQFHYDCEIHAPELLALLSTDFIPAGVYPIFLRNGSLVIQFKPF